MSQKQTTIVLVAKDLASGNIKRVRQELSQLGPGGRMAALGLGASMGAINKSEQALGHLKNRLTSLAGPLAMIGVTGGLLSVAGALEQGITKASSWGLQIEKLGGLTSNTAEQLSGLLGITEKYGISNERLGMIVGFTEKTLGKLEMTAGKAAKSSALLALEQRKLRLEAAGATTSTRGHIDATLKGLEAQKKAVAFARANPVQGMLTTASRKAFAEQTKAINDQIKAHRGHATASQTSALTTINHAITQQKAKDALSKTSGSMTKLMALQKEYGVVLADSKGHALDFQSVLFNVADAYSRATTAADKAKMAALSAAVFGRGYADLVPILKLGRKGIVDAEAAAAQLGLTLSSKNVADLAKFREANREAGDAVSGLELQLGLLVMPDITTGFKGFTSYMASHQDDVKRMFADGLHTAEAFAGFVSGTVVPAVTSIASAATGIWSSIPAPMKDLLVKGFVADRTLKFFFGMSPIHAVVSLASGAIAKGFGGLVGGLFTRGSSPANPMFVSGGLGGGGGPGGILPTIAGIGLSGIAVIAAGAAAEFVSMKDRVGAVSNVADKAMADSVSKMTMEQLKAARSNVAGQVGSPLDILGAPGRALFGGTGAADELAKIDDAIAKLTAVQQAGHGDVRDAAYYAVNHIGINIARALEHQAAKKVIGGTQAGMHTFLTAFRTGGAKVAIQDFDKELRYLSTASDAMKQTSTYSRGLHNNITALKHAMVGASDAQKKILHADIQKLQTLLAAATAAIRGSNDSMATVVSHAMEERGLAVNVTVNTNARQNAIADTTWQRWSPSGRLVNARGGP